MANNPKGKNTNRTNNNIGKVSSDGLDFQFHLYYYVIGLCHDKYDYAVCYEGEMETYGSLDDVILKINPQDDGSRPDAMYLIQAKQSMKEEQLSLTDILHPGNGFTKYIEAYIQYKSSETYKKDGPPTQMIFWTSMGLHSSTKQLMELFESDEDHLKIANAPDSPIEKYWIKHWKKLFIFEMALKLKNYVESNGKDVGVKKCKCDTVAKMFLRDAVEQDKNQAGCNANKRKLKFREEFLDEKKKELLSENGRIFKDCYDLAYKMKKQKPDLAKLKSLDFDDIFDLDFTTESYSDRQPPFEYKGLNEEELDEFFQHFVYCVNVPKGEGMIKLLNNMYKHFDEQVFKKHLKQSCFVGWSFVDSLIKTVKMSNHHKTIQITSVDFLQAKELEKLIETFLCENPIKNRQKCPPLTIVANTNIDWTVSRVAEIVRKTSTTCVIVLDKDVKTFVTELRSINEEFILSEMQTIITVDSKTALELPMGLRMISIVSPESKQSEVAYFEDQINFNDVRAIHFEKFNDKKLFIDDKEINLTKCCSKEVINSKVENIVELYNLQKLDIKSDFYDCDEKHYIERELIEKNEVVTHSASKLEPSQTVSIISDTADQEKTVELLRVAKEVWHSTLTSGPSQTVSIISDTAGQGKTVELLRITKTALSSSVEAICLYFRAKTIANGIPPEIVCSLDVFRYLPNLLRIEPRTSLMEDIVSKCLERNKLILIVDGFDEIIDDSQTIVIKFLRRALEQKSCSLVIATRTEAKPKLVSAFKNARCYTLGKFPFNLYFEKLWLKDRTAPPTETLKSNVKFFVENFDNLLKRAGCRLFLEVPQFCRILGIIYKELINKPNFKLHNNYEIGAIYDGFVHSQFANTFEGYFDETKLVDEMAVEVLKTDFLTKHMALAYYNQYNPCTQAKIFKKLVYYDLILNQGDRYEFIHITVMEYFLVRYFMLEDIELEETKYAFVQFLQRYFCVSRANIADKFIDFFLGDDMCFPLTETKRNIIVRYLLANRKNLPTFVRTTLNNATFNTLKFLLRITPESLLLDLCFRFGSAKQSSDEKKRKLGTISGASVDNEINLKRLGENQVLLLLQALEECDPMIMKTMLFPSDLNEEDIFEVSIRKPFPEVFDRVIMHCNEKFAEEFKSHVQARIGRYAQVIVQHCYAENKERMIDKITRICKEKLNGSTIASFLNRCDLCEILVQNIEVETAGKKFIEDDRLDMLEKILALIDEYLEPESLKLKKRHGRQLISNLKVESVKRRLIEWMCE